MHNELARRRKFTQTVANHIFVNKNTDKIFAIMNSESRTNHFRRNHASTAPCLDWLAISAGFRLADLSKQSLIYKWPLFQTS